MTKKFATLYERFPETFRKPDYSKRENNDLLNSLLYEYNKNNMWLGRYLEVWDVWKEDKKLFMKELHCCHERSNNNLPDSKMVTKNFDLSVIMDYIRDLITHEKTLI